MQHTRPLYEIILSVEIATRFLETLPGTPSDTLIGGFAELEDEIDGQPFAEEFRRLPEREQVRVSAIVQRFWGKLRPGKAKDDRKPIKRFDEQIRQLMKTARERAEANDRTARQKILGVLGVLASHRRRRREMAACACAG